MRTFCSLCKKPIEHGTGYYKTPSYKIICQECRNDLVAQYRQRSRDFWNWSGQTNLEIWRLEREIEIIREKMHKVGPDEYGDYGDKRLHDQLSEEYRRLCFRVGDLKEEMSRRRPCRNDELFNARYVENNDAGYSGWTGFEGAHGGGRYRGATGGYENNNAYGSEETKRAAEEDRCRREAEAERKRAAEEANRKKRDEETARKRRAEEAERRKIEEEAKKKKQLEIYRENKDAILKGKSSINGRRLTEQDYVDVATRTQQIDILKALMRSNSIPVLKALQNNSMVTPRMKRALGASIKEREKIERYGAFLFYLGRFFKMLLLCAVIIIVMVWGIPKLVR